MAIVASLGIAWALGASDLLPQAKGRIGTVTDASSLAQTRNMTITGVNIYSKEMDGDWYQQNSFNISNFDFSNGIRLRVAINKGNNVWDNFDLKPTSADGRLILGENHLEKSDKDGGATNDFAAGVWMKLFVNDKEVTTGNVKYNISLSFTADDVIMTITAPESTVYALNAEFIEQDDELDLTGTPREGWGAKLLAGPDKDGWYSATVSMSDRGGIGVQALDGNNLATEKGYISGDGMSIDPASGKTYTLTSNDAEEFATFDGPRGTYTFSYKPEGNLFKVSKPEAGYYIIGSFNGWSISEGYYKFTEKEDAPGTYTCLMPRILEKNESFVIVKDLDIYNIYNKKGSTAPTGSTPIALSIAKGLTLTTLNNAVKVSEAIVNPEFTFNPEAKTLLVNKWVNPNIWNNPSVDYSSAPKLLLKGANVTINNHATNWNTTGNDRDAYAKFKASENEKFPAADGWMVLKEVSFTNSSELEFGIMRAGTTNAQFDLPKDKRPQDDSYDPGDKGDSYGWIWAKSKENNQVSTETPIDCAYSNYNNTNNTKHPDEGYNLKGQVGTYDLYFNPETMQIVFGGSYAWQFYGAIGTNGRFESIAMQPGENGKWQITFDNCVGGQFSFRHSDPTQATGWRYIGSPVDPADQNSNSISANGTFQGSDKDRENWVSHLTGSHTFILDPLTMMLEVSGDESVVAERVKVMFLNGDEYEGAYGYLQMNNRTPANHHNEMENHKHGAVITVYFSDGSKKYLVNSSETDLLPDTEAPYALQLSDTEKAVHFDLGETDSKFNFALNWRDIKNATFSITTVGKTVEVDENEYNLYRIRGNVWGTNNWNYFKVLDKVDDDWYAATDIHFDGTNFEIVRTNNTENFTIYGGTDNDTRRGTYYGAIDDFYINDGEVHDCVNRYDSEEGISGEGHNFALGQPGTYTVWFSPTKKQIILYGSYKDSKNATVYFVDRDILSGHAKAYAYNNEFIDPNGENSHEDFEVAFGGAPMTLLASDHPLYNLVDPMGTEMKIYSHSFDMNRLPRIRFNDENGGTAEHETRNLRVVDNGVYLFGDELLPSNYYVDEANGGPELCVYPNVYHDMAKNSIYVDVDEFTKYMENGGDISFSIAWEKDSHTMVTTGVRGTTTGVLTDEISGKRYVRLTLSEAAIPDGTMMKMYVWEGTEKNDYLKCGVSGHNHTSIADLNANCTDANRPLAFESVKYVDGGIYTRSTTDAPAQTIQDGIEVYLVEAAEGTLKVFNASGDSESVKELKLERTVKENESDEYYIAKDMNPASTFRIKTVIDGNEYWYAGTSGTNTNMMHSMKYDVERQDATPATSFSIAGNVENITRYDVTFDRMDKTVYAVGVTKEPGFQIHTELNEGHAGNGFFIVDAVANDGDDDNLVWTIDGVTVKQPETSLIIQHDENFGSDEAHHDNTTLSITPTADYETYFSSNGANKLASHTQLTPYTSSDGQTQPGFSSFNVKAYTAGEYTVNIQNKNLYEKNSGTLVFKNTMKKIRLVARPTIQSVGLAINGQLLLPHCNSDQISDNAAGNELFFLLDPEAKPYKTGTLDHTIVWKPEEKTCMETLMATAGPNQIEVYFRIEKENPKGNYAPSVVRRAASATANPSYDLEDGMTKYDIMHTLSTENLGLEAGNTTPANVTFQIKQNGILGRPQTVKVYAALPQDITLPTEIEEIEADDIIETTDGEAVIYDLNGIRVNAENLAPGIYIVVKGEKTEKIIVK